MTHAKQGYGRATAQTRNVRIVRVKIQRQSKHPLQVQWSAKALKSLGRIPDVQLARELGISLDAVQSERRRRGIEPSRPRRPDIHWTDRMIQLLGTDIDSRVAMRLRLPEHSVRQKRQRMNIPSFGGGPEQRHARAFVWMKQKIALLGTDSDRTIAERLGTTRGVVARKRTQLGIAGYYPQRRISWTKEMVALLGKVSDWKIAEKYRMSRASVARERRKLGIPACIETRPVMPTRNLKKILRLPTRKISRQYKLSAETVARLRQKLGVKPLGRWPVRV
jgi:hypothetical protein